jgi:hypothetical protein
MATPAKRKKAKGAHHKKPAAKHRRVNGVTTTKKRTVKRRQVSGVMSKQMGKELLYMGAGMVVAGLVKSKVLNPLERKLTGVNPKMIAAGEVLVGGVFALKSKNNFMKGVGLGVMAGGVMSLSAQLWPNGVIAGDEIGEYYEIGEIPQQYVGEIRQQFVGDDSGTMSSNMQNVGADEHYIPQYNEVYVPLGANF